MEGLSSEGLILGPGVRVQSRSGRHNSSQNCCHPHTMLVLSLCGPSVKKDDGQKLLMISSGRKFPIQSSVSY